MAATARWFGGLLRLSAPRLAPKKAARGKGAAPAQAGVPAGPPGANQLFNIYADRPDEEIKPDSWYPKWLFELDKQPKNYGELSMMFVHGVGIEEATMSDYQRFLRQHRKLVIKINNLRLKKSKRRPGLKIA
uniref:Large ribosomal subunit protein mL54 n=1 Tax=Alexandrium andersonii TaxID=327968 RepID=A0A7S2H0B1_9DINO|mmetsp:Transcript_65914/g.147905  ORF Transcript_65914/g.147905 Transcript_65914/m.147905 type:complete len:132 (+) Transcript_65914:50-445(+)